MLGRQNERNSSYVTLSQGSTLYIWFVFYIILLNEIKLLYFNIFIFGLMVPKNMNKEKYFFVVIFLPQTDSWQ